MNNYSVDVGNELAKSKSTFLKSSLLFSLIFALVIIGDVLLVALANEDYLVNMIIAITISILFTWFAIYFFSNIYNDINSRYRYFKGFDSGLHPVEEVVLLKKSDDLCFVNGLYVYPLIVRYISNFSEQEKIIYTLSKDLDLLEGDKLTICTYQRILIKAEKHS